MARGSSSSHRLRTAVSDQSATVALIARHPKEVGDVYDLLVDFGNVIELTSSDELGHLDVDIALIVLTGDDSDDELLLCGVMLAERGSAAFRLALGPAHDTDLIMSAINVGRCESYLPRSVNHTDLVALLARGLITARRRQAAAGRIPSWMAEQAPAQKPPAPAPQAVDEEPLDGPLVERVATKLTADDHTNLTAPPTQSGLHETLENTREQLAEARQRLRLSQDEILHLELQASISQLVRGLAHELNNPLAAILGQAQRLSRGRDQIEKVIERAQTIEAEVDRCINLVDRLRALAIPTSDRIDAIEPGHLLPVVGDRLSQRGLAIPTIVVNQRLPAVLANERSLVRALELIVENAIEADSQAIELHYSVAHDRALLHVDNNGETPTEEEVRHGVRPFFTTRSQDGHHGLGLTVASALIREMSGALILDCRPDGQRGARCTVALPLAYPSSMTPSRANPIISVQDRVLIIDDEPMVAELLTDAFQESGYGSQTCSTCNEAIEKLQETGYSAILCDVRLPDGDGIDLARRILRKWPEFHGHLALLTGDPSDLHVVAAADELACPVVGKPFHLADIQALLDSLVKPAGP